MQESRVNIIVELRMMILAVRKIGAKSVEAMGTTVPTAKNPWGSALTDCLPPHPHTIYS